jgi:hypothetical protein
MFSNTISLFSKTTYGSLSPNAKSILKTVGILLLLAFVMFAINDAFAGTTATDSLGVKAVYDKYFEIVNDKYVSGTISLFLIIGALMIFNKSMIAAFIFIGLAVAVVKLQSIVEAITTGTIPMGF